VLHDLDRAAADRHHPAGLAAERDRKGLGLVPPGRVGFDRAFDQAAGLRAEGLVLGPVEGKGCRAPVSLRMA